MSSDRAHRIAVRIIPYFALSFSRTLTPPQRGTSGAPSQSLRKNAMTTSGRPSSPGVRRERLLEQQAALAALSRIDVSHGDHLEETLRFITETAAHLMSVARVSPWRYDLTH